MNNLITNEGEDIEKYTKSIDGIKVTVIKKPDDPTTNRISMGGDLRVGFYCVYRGDKNMIKAILQNCLEAL